MFGLTGMNENETGSSDQCRGYCQQHRQKLESEETGKEESYGELGHLLDCFIEVLATVGADLVQVAGLQVIREADQDDAGEDEERPKEVDHPACTDGETLNLPPVRPVAEQVQQEAGPEQEGSRDHDVALPLLRLVVQLKHVVQGRAFVRPGEVSAGQLEDFLDFFLGREALC